MQSFSEEHLVEGTRTALVTGSTAGIGEWVARGLVQSGWRVLVHGRTNERAATAIDRMGPWRQRCVPVVADLESLSGVVDLVGQVRDRVPHGLDVLVNNAGAAFPERQLTVDGIERTIAVNHVAAAALTMSLTAELLRSAARRTPRVIMVSSYLEKRARSVADWTYARGWGQVGAYAFSKHANLAYGYALARRFDGVIDVFMIDPGSVRTDFQKRAGGPLRLVGAVGGVLMSSAEHAARGVIDAALLPEVAPTGSYLRAGRVRKSSARSRNPDHQDAIALQTDRVIATA